MHNEITDKYDNDMMDRLNTSLDNMLIFVSQVGQRNTLTLTNVVAGWSLFCCVDDLFG